MAFGSGKKEDEKKSQNPPANSEKDPTTGLPKTEGAAATPAEGDNDQGHGDNDSKKSAFEQAQAVASIDQGSQARGVLTVNDPNPHERFEGAGFRTSTRYQSDAARAALLNPEDADRINEHNIQDAEIGTTNPDIQVAIDLDALNKKIIVKPRQTVSRFRIGETWYSLTEGKEVLIPQHVALILAEKGIV